MHEYHEYGEDRLTACVIYARVSSSRQATENASIDTQLDACRAFAKARGLQIVAEYVDPGASAWSDAGRPQFDTMIERAREPDPGFQMIVVYDQSRFYRKVRLSEQTRFTLRLNGVRVQSVMQPFEDDGLFGSFAITMQSVMDEQQSRITSTKVRAGLVSAARAGFSLGGPTPYGYKLVEVEKWGAKSKKKLAIDDEQAKVVRMIYELYESGLGYASIVKRLNEEGYRASKGREWYKSDIGRILTASTYVGRLYFKPSHPVTKRPLPKNHWIEIAVPAIISEAQFENVQRLAASRDRKITPPRYTTSDAVLGKIAKCGSCGGNLQISTGKSHTGTVYHYYKCAAKLNKGSCKGGKPITIRRDELEDAVVRKMASDLLTPGRVRETLARAVERQDGAREIASGRLQQLKRQLQNAKRKEENLWELAASLGVKTKEGFMSKLDSVQEEAASLQRQIAANEKLLASAVRALTEEEAEAKVSQMRGLLLSADIKRKRRFVHSLVERVIVTEEAIEIIGTESTFAETASGLTITPPPVRGTDREWWAVTGSNRRPSRCKRDALPTELTARACPRHPRRTPMPKLRAKGKPQTSESPARFTAAM